MVLLVALMVAVSTGVSQAAVVTFDDTKNLNKDLFGIGTWSYFHDMPTDFGVPPDVIIDANLTITYMKALAFGYLSVHGETVPGSPGFAITWKAKDAGFDLSSVLDPWVEGSQLQVDVTGLGMITLLTSKFHLEYENVAPVPEPGTLMLLGSGLIGMAIWGRKTFRK